VGAKLFHADKQTDKTKLLVDFRDHENVPKVTEFYLPGCKEGIISHTQAVFENTV
jgi:hypothetical protein